MDLAKPEDWAEMRQEIRDLRMTMPARIKRMLLSLKELEAGGAFMVDQLTHCLQVATLAERAGASEEVVLAALLHDIGKAASPENHGPIAAEILKPVVSEATYWVVKVHQDFQGRYFYEHIGRDRDAFRRYEKEPWFDLACQFSSWDQAAFDPSYDTLPLSHFEPLIEKFWRARIPAAPAAPAAPVKE
jgi:putative nucleotidyltransferase with HDIG domain